MAKERCVVHVDIPLTPFLTMAKMFGGMGNQAPPPPGGDDFEF